MLLNTDTLLTSMEDKIKDLFSEMPVSVYPRVLSELQTVIDKILELEAKWSVKTITDDEVLKGYRRIKCETELALLEIAEISCGGTK